MKKINYEQRILKDLDCIIKLLAQIYAQCEDINLKKRIRVLTMIGLSETDVSNLTKKPLAIVKVMK